MGVILEKPEGFFGAWLFFLYLIGRMAILNLVCAPNLATLSQSPATRFKT